MPISTILRKIKTGFTYPGAFFRYQSNELRRFYHGFSRVAHPITYAKRCNDNADRFSQKKLSIPEQDGYAVISADDIPDNLAADVVAEVRERLKKIDINEVRKDAKKPYLLSLIKGHEISRDSAIYRLVKNPEIVGCVARYLKCFPILTYVAVWYSPNDLQDQTGSQKYHLDHEDFKQIKAFMAIEDVAKENGPFTLIPASESDRIQKKLGYTMTPENKQVDDEKMYEVISRDSAKPFVGSAGTLALVDTSRCFHYGSREGTKPRILLTFQYMTPFAYVMPWNWKKKPSLDHLHSENLPEFERKLLGLTA